MTGGGVCVNSGIVVSVDEANKDGVDIEGDNNDICVRLFLGVWALRRFFIGFVVVGELSNCFKLCVCGVGDGEGGGIEFSIGVCVFCIGG